MALRTLTRRRAGAVTACLGSLANLARTIQRPGVFAEAVGSVYLMGGSFGPEAKPEHNILSEVTAARIKAEGSSRSPVAWRPRPASR